MASIKGFNPAQSGQKPEDDANPPKPVPVGVWGDSTSGVGVFGTSGALTSNQNNIPIRKVAGVTGHSLVASGVRGESILGEGVVGRSQTFIGISGFAEGSGPAGVFGSSAEGGSGVLGFVDGDVTGVSGSTDTGVGVFGESGSRGNQPGVGVWGSSGSGTPGVRPSSVGVFGEGLGGENSIGVHGSSNQGEGVLGESTTKSGVHGLSTSQPGVFGESQSEDGVRGHSPDAGHAGVAGLNFGSGQGIFGQSTLGLAGDFNGNVRVTGTIVNAFASSKIDHPLDPENRYLYHSSVESPDMLNVYNGNITTDGNGDAIVKMPDYFEALNQDFRYQLTVIEQFAQAMVANEMKDNSFVIKTDKPHVKVSWMVTGVRQDTYANAHRISVEEDKPAEERGRYLHPELWGQPKEAGIVRWSSQPQNQPHQVSHLEPQQVTQRLKKIRKPDLSRFQEELHRLEKQAGP
jgi:hypothetical protein